MPRLSQNAKCEGRVYYEKKLAEGKTHKEALRSLKRRISDAIFARLLAAPGGPDAAAPRVREGNQGTTLTPGAAGHAGTSESFGQATPGPGHHVRPGTRAATPSPSKPTSRKP